MLDQLDEGNWSLMMQGQLFETGKSLIVTPFDTLKTYIREELKPIAGQGGTNEQTYE